MENKSIRDWDIQQMGQREYSENYFRFLNQKRSPLRQWVRNRFLNSARSLVRGKCADLGCGTGELLRLLPSGSVGLEVNRCCVDFLNGLKVDCRWCSEEEAFELKALSAEDGIETLVCSHVLEHLAFPDEAITTLVRNCRRLGIRRLVSIVPDWGGFVSHDAHVTFCDEAFFRRSLPVGWRCEQLRHFPFANHWMQRHFCGNELQVVWVDCGE